MENSEDPKPNLFSQLPNTDDSAGGPIPFSPAPAGDPRVLVQGRCRTGKSFIERYYFESVEKALAWVNHRREKRNNEYEWHIFVLTPGAWELYREPGRPFVELTAPLPASIVPCCRCGGVVHEFTIPNEIWNSLIRWDGPETEREYLCFGCFAAVAQDVCKRKLDFRDAEISRLKFRVDALEGPGVMRINWVAREIHEWAVAKGWWQNRNRNMGELLALVHSEVSEALEEWREGKIATYFEGEKKKPCGLYSELADVVIRVMDIFVAGKQDLEYEIATKMAYNHGREYRHGGKRV